MTPSKTLFFLCISFVIGIALQSITKIPQIFIWGFLVGGVVFIVAGFFIKKPATIFGFCLLFLVLGILRFQITEFAIASDKVRQFNDKPDKIILTGRIIDESDTRDTSQKLKVKIDNTESVVLVTVGRYPEYYYLDTIKITGKLKSPFITEDFNYKNYLMKDGIYSVMDYPKTELILRAKSYTAVEFLYQNILFFKERLKASIHLQFSLPHSSIIEGIILGGSANMPQDTKDKFRATGLTHLTAISGSNVVILSTILMTFLLALGFWRGQSFYVSSLFIWLYIIIAGFPASGIRAAIMATIFLLAQKLGRQNTSSRVIVLAGSLMLLQNPMLLRYDIGFQLSFLASMGIIYIKPLFDYFFAFLAKKEVRFFIDIISITLAAQIATLPIIAYYFENISLVAPITNLLIIPIINAVMIFGFLAAFFGLFSFTVGFIFSLPAYFLMLYFMKIVDIFAQPWAVKTIESVFWVWLPIYYALLAGLIWWLDKKIKPKFLGY